MQLFPTVSKAKFWKMDVKVNRSKVGKKIGLDKFLILESVTQYVFKEHRRRTERYNSYRLP